MKRITGLLRTLILLLVVMALSLLSIKVRAEFIRVAQVNSGTAQTLLKVLQSVAYQGNSSLDEAIICNPVGSSNIIYLGSDANVNADSGVPIRAGACFTFRTSTKPIDATQIFLFVSSNQNAELLVRQRN